MKDRVRLNWGGNIEAQREADEAFKKLKDHPNLHKRKKRKERKARWKARQKAKAEAVNTPPVVVMAKPKPKPKPQAKKKKGRKFAPFRERNEFRKITAEFHRLIDDTD